MAVRPPRPAGTKRPRLEACQFHPESIPHRARGDSDAEELPGARPLAAIVILRRQPQKTTVTRPRPLGMPRSPHPPPAEEVRRRRCSPDDPPAPGPTALAGKPAVAPALVFAREGGACFVSSRQNAGQTCARLMTIATPAPHEVLSASSAHSALSVLLRTRRAPRGNGSAVCKPASPRAASKRPTVTPWLCPGADNRGGDQTRRRGTSPAAPTRRPPCRASAKITPELQGVRKPYLDWRLPWAHRRGPRRDAPWTAAPRACSTPSRRRRPHRGPPARLCAEIATSCRSAFFKQRGGAPGPASVPGGGRGLIEPPGPAPACARRSGGGGSCGPRPGACWRRPGCTRWTPMSSPPSCRRPCPGEAPGPYLHLGAPSPPFAVSRPKQPTIVFSARSRGGAAEVLSRTLSSCGGCLAHRAPPPDRVALRGPT